MLRNVVQYVRAVCATVSVLVGVAATSASMAQTLETTDAELAGRVKLGLRAHDCRIAPLGVRQELDGSLRLDTVVDGAYATLRLAPVSSRSPHYQVLVQAADGSLKPVEPTPEASFRGTVDEYPGATAGGTWLNDGFHGLVLMPDGTKHWIQPVASVAAGADPIANLHVSYRDTDLQTCDKVCGVSATHRAAAPQAPLRAAAAAGGPPGVLPSSSSLCIAQLAIDADREFYQTYGSVSATEARINAIINAVNTQYATQVGITHEITTIIVRTAEPDPYSSTDADTLLDQFGNHWDSNHGGVQRDIAHLFTGKNMDSGTIGLAWVGAICESSTYGYGLSEGTFTLSFGCISDLCAHEIGHNWNAGHCSCPAHTMNPVSTCANQFSSESIQQIRSFRDGIGCLDCGALYSMAHQVMGNSAGDRIGESVAMGDVNGDDVPDLVVGAPYDDQRGSNAGKVWVFDGNSGALLWTRLGQAAGDRFGQSVAVGGGRVLVGAPENDAKAPNAGRAYVCNGVTGSFLRVYNGGSTGDRFGWSVSTGHDTNHDGVDDFLIGAPYSNLKAIDAGAVYLYSGSTFGLRKRLLGESAGDRFGWSVALLGRLNVDSYSDYIVGAPYRNAAGADFGRAYVYSGVNHAILKVHSGQKAGDQFGRVVAGVGDINGDTRQDYAIGAPYFDLPGKVSTGRVYVFSGLSRMQVWTKSGVNAGDLLGSAISTAGDANADGHDEVLVGAPRQDTGAVNSGRAYVCSSTNGATLFSFTGLIAGDLAASSVAGWSGEGVDRVAISVPRRNDPASDAGQVVVFNTLGGSNDSNDSGSSGSSGSNVAFCAADVAGQDSRVDVQDLLAVILHWNQCSSPCTAGCIGDATRDCHVGTEDLETVINAWGPCP